MTNDVLLDQMASSDYVKVRTEGVIGGFLARTYAVGPEPLDAAQELVKRMTEAGLATFIFDDLRACIDDIKINARRSS